MLDAVGQAASHLLTFEALSMIVLGSIVGSVFGAMPGLSSISAMVLVLPFTFGMDPRNAMYIYAGIIGSAGLSGSIPAITLNTPGTAGSIATCFDGFPMSQRGQAARALSVAACASAAGTVVGAVVLFTLLPAIRPVVLLFGAPEVFFLVVGGIACIAFVTEGSFVKGLASGGLGLLASFIGANSAIGSSPRFSGGTLYLFDGLPLVAIFIGMFAFGELLHYAARGGQIAQHEVVLGRSEGRGQVGQGIRDVLEHPLLVLRSAVIGILVGIVPGAGAPTASLLSYSVGKRLSKNASSFGQGTPEGVIASETANDAKDGGALLPTVALGVPGSADQAVLLAAFILHGLTPGPLLIRNHLDLVIALLFGLIISQLLTSAMTFAGASHIARITTIDVRYFAPFITVFCLIGSYSLRNNVWDVFTAVAFGAIGYLFKRYGFSLVTFAMGVTLGVLAEMSFVRTMDIGRGSFLYVFSRPVTLVLLAVLALLAAAPRLMKLGQAKAEGVDAEPS